jgi:hypothetical protein
MHEQRLARHPGGEIGREEQDAERLEAMNQHNEALGIYDDRR